MISAKERKIYAHLSFVRFFAVLLAQHYLAALGGITYGSIGVCPVQPVVAGRISELTRTVDIDDIKTVGLNIRYDLPSGVSDAHRSHAELLQHL